MIFDVLVLLFPFWFSLLLLLYLVGMLVLVVQRKVPLCHWLLCLSASAVLLLLGLWCLAHVHGSFLIIGLGAVLCLLLAATLHVLHLPHLLHSRLVLASALTVLLLTGLLFNFHSITDDPDEMLPVMQSFAQVQFSADHPNRAVHPLLVSAIWGELAISTEDEAEELSCTYDQLGVAMNLQGHPKAAAHCWRRALHHAQAAGADALCGSYHTKLGLSALEVGDKDAALNHARQACQDFEENPPENPFPPLAGYVYAAFCRRDGDWEETARICSAVREQLSGQENLKRQNRLILTTVLGWEAEALEQLGRMEDAARIRRDYDYALWLWDLDETDLASLDAELHLNLF